MDYSSIEFIIGAYLIAGVLGYSLGFNLLTFKRAAEVATSG
ncbi:hypothetical protein [Vibrio nigripulchritudo]|nr:hypothetical protein [Vibrio nigripulchritudo]